MIDHTFIPGDRSYGWERQCSVYMPVREGGRWVSAHCGAPPEEHPKTDEPVHARDCREYLLTGNEPCDCWVSARPEPRDETKEST